MTMTDDIKEQVKGILRAKKVTQKAFAESVGLLESNFSRMLNASHGISDAWQKVFKGLKVKVVLVPDDDQEKGD